MGRLDDLIFHEDCDNSYCRVCLEANEKLADVLESSLGNRSDWLGLYHGWLSIKGIPPETDGGWWSREALNDANVQEFIKEHAEEAP